MKESERIRGSESSKSGVKLTRRDDLGLGWLHLRNPRSSGQPKATTKRTPAANFVFSSFSHVSHFFSLPTDELSSQAFFKTQLRSRISRLRPPPPWIFHVAHLRSVEILWLNWFWTNRSAINDSRRITNPHNFPKEGKATFKSFLPTEACYPHGGTIQISNSR